MIAWLTTRNTHEAAALAALDIALRPVTAVEYKSGREYTDWNMARDNSAAMADVTRCTGTLYNANQIRRDHAKGTLPILHPFLISLRALTNRARLLLAQRGQAMHSAEDAPGSFVLVAGSDGAPPLPTHTPHITTGDMDLTVAAITCGARIMKIDECGNDQHAYRFSRVTMSGLDIGPLMVALRNGELFPKRRWEQFSHAIHTLHCLRELRRHQHTDRFITVSHKTPYTKGAAFNEKAKSDVLENVERKLGITL